MQEKNKINKKARIKQETGLFFLTRRGAVLNICD